ncbi:hypothetical protein ACQJBY_050573 [Aegilops geniculata]
MSAAVPCSLLSSSVSSHLAHPPISLSPGRTGACHGLGSAPPSPENVVRHRFFDHNYRIKLPRLRSTRSRPPQPRLVVGRAERRPWPPDSRAPPAKVAARCTSAAGQGPAGVQTPSTPSPSRRRPAPSLAALQTGASPLPASLPPLSPRTVASPSDAAQVMGVHLYIQNFLQKISLYRYMTKNTACRQYAETEAKDDRQLLEEDTSNQSGKLSSFSSGSNAKYCNDTYQRFYLVVQYSLGA